ncbi:pre-mRNA-splicing factor CWC25 homolog [Pieris brassicae]|uniref:pre-mRNA-splicing factor CWC25 homolog n=1 Tax=Pieris brassicae TaxID=7116 RepID=UPI001E661AA6|nr:pre-mRNA-splicing factor CWC25 homolog [Pieris brassicae]
MGGGDLNSKKSWHPNTMKNQERVWKAEKVAAEEKKRILELQQERAQEKDRQELNELARKNAANNSDNRLDWMYNKPDKQVQHEEYLLGKAIDKNFEQHGKPEHSEIPAVARRVVGSSMLSGASDVQVDLARKIREDPLLLVKERERAARAALLNNPVQRKRLTELLRIEQEQKKGHKEKKKHKKKDKDLDNMLAAKLTALSSNKIDLAKLLESDDSSDDDSSVEEKSKKKKKKSKSKNKNSDKSHKKNKTEKSKSKKHRTKYDSSSDSDESIDTGHKHSRKRSSSRDNESVPHNKKYKKDSPEQYSPDNRQDIRHEPQYKRYYDYEANQREFNKARIDKSEDKYVSNKYRHHSETQSNRETKRYSPIRKMNKNEKSIEQSRSKKGLSDAEKAARLAEMAAAGAEREIQRGRRVAEQKEENKAAEKASASRIPSRNEARAIPDSLESRIHSNRHYIQRSEKHMSENFARR